MREVKAAEEVEIAFDAVGVVAVVVEEKAQDIRRTGLDHARELVLRKGFVADEADFPDRELVAFLDLEDEIDAIARGIDRLRLDPHVEIAVLAVKRDDVLDIVVDDGARQRPAVFRLQRLLEVFVLDLLVALEDEPRDGRIFDDRHQHAIAGLRNFHVLERGRWRTGSSAPHRARRHRAGRRRRRENASGSWPHQYADCRRLQSWTAGGVAAPARWPAVTVRNPTRNSKRVAAIARPYIPASTTERRRASQSTAGAEA